MPYEWGHPQFDAATAARWADFVAENPYAQGDSRLWKPLSPAEYLD